MLTVHLDSPLPVVNLFAFRKVVVLIATKTPSRAGTRRRDRGQGSDRGLRCNERGSSGLQQRGASCGWDTGIPGRWNKFDIEVGEEGKRGSLSLVSAVGRMIHELDDGMSETFRRR